ncbi:MAG: hypothetical protein WA949_17635 [Phormidesmis sp.]
MAFVEKYQWHQLKKYELASRTCECKGRLAKAIVDGMVNRSGSDEYDLD